MTEREGSVQQPDQQQKEATAISLENKQKGKPWEISFLWLSVSFLFLLIIGAILQTYPIMDRTNQVPVEQTAEVQSPSDGLLFLHVVYPPKLNVSGIETSRAPISIWLSYATGLPTSVPTSSKQTQTSTQNPNQTGAASVEPTLTPSPTATPYMLALYVTPNSLTFMDGDGHPVPAQIALTPSRFSVTPAVMFLQINPNDTTGQSLAIIPAIREANSYQELQPISISRGDPRLTQLLLVLSLVLTPPAIGSVLAALAVQYWTTLQEKRRTIEKETQDEQVKRKNLADNLKNLIKQKPAESARLYLDARRAFTDTEFLDIIWSDAPQELKNLVELERVSKDLEFAATVEGLGKEKVESAIKFAIQHRLDEDWESRASTILQTIVPLKLSWRDKLDGQLLVWDEYRTREALLKVWPNISYWRLAPLSNPETSSFDEKTSFYEKTPHPFGAPQAEENIWLFDGRFLGRYGDQPGLQNIDRMDSVIVSGTPGWGKTTTALWLMNEALRIKTAFPVYIPASLNTTLIEIAPIFAQTLLHYLAINPSAFLKRGIAGKANIAHLLAEYIGKESNLTLLLREAGLPPTGAGLELEQEIQHLAKSYSSKSQQKELEILSMLSESYPDGFNTTWLLMDIQEDVDDQKNLDNLFELISQLNRIGLKTKVFLSNKVKKPANLDKAPIPVKTIRWSLDDLNGLTAIRLQRLGEVSLTALCNREVLELSKTPEERLTIVAAGKPGILVQKGNELLKCIGLKKDLLTQADLLEILGPI